MGLNPLYTLFLLYLGYRVGSVLGMIFAVPIGLILLNLYQAGAFDYILNDVFGERLPFLDDNPPILENLSSLEKLTSRTTRTSPHGTVQLEHLQVVEGGRQQWHIQRDGEGGYIFQAVSGDPGHGERSAQGKQPSVPRRG